MSSAQILVVEDEGIVARSIQCELTSLGYNVPAVASSGEEALRKAAETLPDLVLMDIALAGEMDGVETTRRMRERFNLPVIYLTAYVDEPTLERAKLTEPYGYLLKPYEERELHTTIEMALYKHRMEAKLQETERWLAATLKSIGDAVIVTDARGNIRNMNPVAQTLTGCTFEHAEGKGLEDIVKLVDRDARGATRVPTNWAFQKGRAVEIAGLFLAAKDAETPIEGTAAPVYDEKQHFTGFVLVFRDVSKRRQAEEALRHSQEQRRHAQKVEALGRMAASMAQDFNSLLTSVLGNLSVVLSSVPTSDPTHDYVVCAENAAWQATNFVNKLLSFSRQTLVQLEPTDLNVLIQKMEPILRAIINASIQIEFRLAPALDLAPADPLQINEVFLNLCLNARDAMPEGGRLVIETENVTVTSEMAQTNPQAKPGPYVRLRIEDTGCGIAPEIRPQIFEPFFTTKAPGKGAGLGLALSSVIVKQHRGWIEYASEVNQGTRFDVFLPVQGAESA